MLKSYNFLWQLSSPSFQFRSMRKAYFSFWTSFTTNNSSICSSLIKMLIFSNLLGAQHKPSYTRAKWSPGKSSQVRQKTVMSIKNFSKQSTISTISYLITCTHPNQLTSSNHRLSQKWKGTRIRPKFREGRTGWNNLFSGAREYWTVS